MFYCGKLPLNFIRYLLQQVKSKLMELVVRLRWIRLAIGCNIWRERSPKRRSTDLVWG